MCSDWKIWNFCSCCSSIVAKDRKYWSCALLSIKFSSWNEAECIWINQVAVNKLHLDATTPMHIFNCYNFTIHCAPQPMQSINSSHTKVFESCYSIFLEWNGVVVLYNIIWKWLLGNINFFNYCTHLHVLLKIWKCTPKGTCTPVWENPDLYYGTWFEIRLGPL